MALLEQINSMKESGLSDVQIINTLKESGFSPMDINDALSQSKIKAAVSQEIPEDIQQETESGMEGMQASAMAAQEGQQFISTAGQTGIQNAPQYQEQAAVPQAAEAPAYYPPEAQAPAQYQEQQAAYAYPQEAQAGYYAQALDIETARDIAKQQVEEALKKIRGEVSELLKFRSDIKFEIQDIQNRLAKVESTMNDLQYSVIKKVSEYGEQISGISKEIKMTQDSFSKIVGPFMDKQRGMGRKETANEEPEEAKEEKQKKEGKKGKQEKQEPQTAQKRTGKSESGASFEDYFR